MGKRFNTLFFPSRGVNARPVVPSSGASDVGSGSGHVHLVGHRRVPGADHLHEEFGCQPARQEEQEAAGLHIPHQK